MKEKTLHYIWKNRLFDGLTLDGDPLEVLDVGQYNVGDGPDFGMAKVRSGELVWIGSVEMHLRSSDWTLHGHQNDPRYDHIILHVVLENDRPASDTGGNPVPTALLTVSEALLKRIDELEIGSKALRCTPELSYLSPHTLRTLLSPLLEEKITEGIRRHGADKDLHTLFYRLLMRYLGAHRNNEVMEQVAMATPLPFLRKHASDPEALESMLLGQAALFAGIPRDDYEEKLAGRYAFYREKFGLTPIPGGLFRKLRVRPPAYPARILATAAQVLHREEELSEAMSSGDFARAKELLSVSPSPYWQTHIDFGQTYTRKLGGISTVTIDSLLINAVLPAAFLYCQKVGNTRGAAAALKYYEELPPENNRFIRLFMRNGFAAHTAGDTQKMLRLYTRYCEPFRCLSCPLAPAILRSLHEEGCPQ